MTSHQTQPCNPRVSRRSLGFLIAREPGGRVRSLPLHPSLSLRAEKGQTRALKPQQLFTSQTYAAQVYRSELAVRLKDLGYTVERGEYGQPEIQGYTREYMEASSPRREQVKDHLRAEGLEGAAAAQIAAHRTRDSKEQLPAEEVLRQHKELAAQYGNQAERVVAEARTYKHVQERGQAPESAARQGVTYARDHVFERTAVDSERTILTAAMDRSMGEATYGQVRQEFDRRVKTGEFRAVEHGAGTRNGHEGQQYTTAETLRMEREILSHTRTHHPHRTRGRACLVAHSRGGEGPAPGA